MADRLYLYRLKPPRADFAQTMSDDEQRIMHAHQAFWRELLAEGRVVVFGPVADPEGVWGMGVLRAPTQVEVNQIGAVDPAVSSGLMTFDVLEIMGGLTG